MAFFLGYQEVKLDGKGRLTLPVRYRAKFAENVRAMKMDILGLCLLNEVDASDWKKAIDLGGQTGLMSESLKIDKRRRVRLPDAFLTEEILSEGRVVLVGVGLRLEIWAASDYRRNVLGKET